uniref:Uncharacterized protein n=1 Tax=Opuntia streptacantha TaxID=393608 RepID=A0A7C8YXB8_OPUST
MGQISPLPLGFIMTVVTNMAQHQDIIELSYVVELDQSSVSSRFHRRDCSTTSAPTEPIRTSSALVTCVGRPFMARTFTCIGKPLYLYFSIVSLITCVLSKAVYI